MDSAGSKPDPATQRLLAAVAHVAVSAGGPGGLRPRKPYPEPYPEISNSEQFSAVLTPLYKAKRTPRTTDSRNS